MTFSLIFLLKMDILHFYDYLKNDMGNSMFLCLCLGLCHSIFSARTAEKMFSALWKNRSHYVNFSQSYNFWSCCGKYGVLRKIHFGIKFSFWEF